MICFWRLLTFLIPSKEIGNMQGKLIVPSAKYSALNSSHTPVYWNSLHFLKLKFIENILSSALTLLLKVHTLQYIPFLSLVSLTSWIGSLHIYLLSDGDGFLCVLGGGEVRLLTTPANASELFIGQQRKIVYNRPSSLS